MANDRFIGAASLLCVLALPVAASGQEVGGRAYEQTGLSAGGFTVYPAIEAGPAVTDNVAQSPDDRRSDMGLRIAPELKVRSGWSRHSLSFDLDSEHVLYARESDEDTNNVSLNGAFRLDVRRDLSVETEARYSLSDENPGSADVPSGAVGRVQDQSFGGSVGTTYRPGRVVARLRGTIDWYRYGDVDLGDGSVEDNSDRDYMAPEIELRVGYDITPAVRPFISVGYGPRIHSHKTDRNGLKRDSQGVSVSAGIVLEPSSLWSGEIGLRYEMRDYDDPALKTADVVGFFGSLLWRPTRLTDVRLSVDSGLDETSLEDASAVRYHSAVLGVSHRLRRYLTATGELSYALDHYVGAGIDEETWQASLGLSYSIDRQIALVAGYRYTLFDSSVPDRDYTENRVTVGMRLQR